MERPRVPDFWSNNSLAEDEWGKEQQTLAWKFHPADAGRYFHALEPQVTVQ
jgi:hypothetical protein